MPEQFLDRADVCPGLQQVGRETVAQRVEVERAPVLVRLLNPGAFKRALVDPHRVRRPALQRRAFPEIWDARSFMLSDEEASGIYSKKQLGTLSDGDKLTTASDHTVRSATRPQRNSRPVVLLPLRLRPRSSRTTGNTPC